MSARSQAPAIADLTFGAAVSNENPSSAIIRNEPFKFRHSAAAFTQPLRSIPVNQTALGCFIK